LFSHLFDGGRSDVPIWDIGCSDSRTCAESDAPDPDQPRSLADGTGGHTSDVDSVYGHSSDVGRSEVPIWDIGCSDSRTSAESEAPGPDQPQSFADGPDGHASEVESLRCHTSDIGMVDFHIWIMGCSDSGICVESDAPDPDNPQSITDETGGHTSEVERLVSRQSIVASTDTRGIEGFDGRPWVGSGVTGTDDRLWRKLAVG
jgi:hypothetical protein